VKGSAIRGLVHEGRLDKQAGMLCSIRLRELLAFEHTGVDSEFRNKAASTLKFKSPCAVGGCSELKKADQRSGNSGADQWAYDRDGSIGPVRVTLAGDGEKEVSDARAEVARGIDGVSRGAAE
jgi:hypothetical protein